MSAAAFAAEVVEMRLGRHAAYTRVVFELDGPAGYSLEQSVLPGGDTELVVTLDAGATNQEASLRNSQVNGVSLTGQGAKSVARIRLGSDGLRVKEMILGSPPRIVLDVLAPEGAAVAKAAKSAPTPARTPAPVTTTTKAKPAATTPTHSIVPKSTPNVRAEQPVASINRGASPSPSRVTTRPAAAPAARPSAPPREPQRVQAAAPMAPKPAAKAPAKVANTPPPPARKKPSLPPAPASLPESNSTSLLTPMNLGGLALVGLVGSGAYFMLRRRGHGDELIDESDTEAESDENPFASLGDEFTVAALPESSDETAEIPMAVHVDESEASASNDVDEFASEPDPNVDAPMAKVAADSGLHVGPQEDLFDTSVPESLGAHDNDTTTTDDSTAMLGTESAEAGGEKMETYTDSGIDAGMDAMPPMAGASDNSEVMRMLREFEQRVSGLESKLEEVSEAKERLERQVAAQTEELRVQRAAIARTQRALRNMSRPDDESPTEPALRDPNI